LPALSLIGVLLIIYSDFRTLRLTILVALTLPFALIGGVFGAVFGGGVLSLGSLVGFVTVLGIAARNGIMLVSHYRHLEDEEGEPFGPELVIRGSEERLAPILLACRLTWSWKGPKLSAYQPSTAGGCRCRSAPLRSRPEPLCG
jgi:Cu/Ag efflux pump CusA